MEVFARQWLYLCWGWKNRTELVCSFWSDFEQVHFDLWIGSNKNISDKYMFLLYQGKNPYHFCLDGFFFSERNVNHSHKCRDSRYIQKMRYNLAVFVVPEIPVDPAINNNPDCSVASCSAYS